VSDGVQFAGWIVASLIAGAWAVFKYRADRKARQGTQHLERKQGAAVDAALHTHRAELEARRAEFRFRLVKQESPAQATKAPGGYRIVPPPPTYYFELENVGKADAFEVDVKPGNPETDKAIMDRDKLRHPRIRTNDKVRLLASFGLENTSAFVVTVTWRDENGKRYSDSLDATD
jgi:hypothetical protein